MICDNISVNSKGHLTFAGRDTVDLAKKYGTPLYLMDEDKIREHVRTYRDTMKRCFPEGSLPEYASKAFSCRAIYRIMAEEGIDIDVVSAGEIYTAASAGFPMEKSFFHGNSKTDANIRFAIENKVGHFVVDNFDELKALDIIAAEYGIVQKILLRVTPGIDPHTNKKISTGTVDSKFGVAIETGQALEFTKTALELKNVKVCGFHCHVGSQCFLSEPFSDAAEMMMGFIAAVRDQFGYTAEMLNLGGGLGVKYTEEHPQINYGEKIEEIALALNKWSTYHGVPMPKILMEPGRSMVADAGMTLYTIGSVKTITGHKSYIAVDGGMTDNPRYTLYEAPYTVELASRVNAAKDFTASVVGRCCESGDIIQENVKLPTPVRGDILAVLTTGAYNYSMASNYNRIPRPPVVMLKKDGEYVAVKRETLKDLCALDE